jgi:hypothetical protein
MTERMVVMTVTATFESAAEQARGIPEILRSFRENGIEVATPARRVQVVDSADPRQTLDPPVYASTDTPYFLRPIAGGVGSVRGFPDAGLSGPLGAQALCQASAEWRHPLIGSKSRSPRVVGTVFADAGDHWDAGGQRADPAAATSTVRRPGTHRPGHEPR